MRKYRARFDEIYKENCLKHTKPYSGMKELIDELYHQGYKLAVVTNKPKINAVTIVNHLFPGKFMYVLEIQFINQKTTSLFSTTSYAVNGK